MNLKMLYLRLKFFELLHKLGLATKQHLNQIELEISQLEHENQMRR